MLDARALITKYKGKGVFVDANLLVLLLVGKVNLARIVKFKRTQNFEVSDFFLLERLVAWFGNPLVSTPHVLSQVSDLTDLSGCELSKVRTLLKTTIEIASERYSPALELVRHPLFERFGLGDASVAHVCAQNVVVLTADVELSCVGAEWA